MIGADRNWCVVYVCGGGLWSNFVYVCVAVFVYVGEKGEIYLSNNNRSVQVYGSWKPRGFVLRIV